MSEPSLQEGARNLLCNCAGGKAGDTVLIVGESGPDPYYEPRLVDEVCKAASGLNMKPICILAEPPESATDFPASVAEAMQDADITVFFSRIGDRVRFVSSPGGGTKVMSYALTKEYLASAFGTTNYCVTEVLHERLLETISSASGYRIRSEGGTDLTAELHIGESRSDLIPFALKLFPTMIFPPIGFRNLNGTLTIDYFTLSSSTRSYEDSVLMVSSPIRARIENNVMTAFDGDNAMVEAFAAQCERAARITGGDPFRLNSWHTGINPNTFYDRDPYADLERWGTVAYGSPRYTHIHAAGKDPGDLAIQLFDASICFDDERIWNDGSFVFLDRPDNRALLKKSGQSQLVSDINLDIGIHSMRNRAKAQPAQ
ncbi:MAG: hypothetical protein OXI87_22235 [Albidovulum sp.]|nr:hypothetical protein [Albidovulum sp.]